MSALRPMKEAPRDGTRIVAEHIRTGEPMIVWIRAEEEIVLGVIDYAGLWSYQPEPQEYAANGKEIVGFVREEHLAGWRMA